jgi:hypothetical protein
MRARPILMAFSFLALTLAAARPALALANRVFVSARIGSDANACDGVTTPCLSFAGALAQVNADGEIIVLDSGGYGAVTITKAVTIEAPQGVTAFVHPADGTDAITVGAPGGTVTLRGLVLNIGNTGIRVNAVGRLNVERCYITGFALYGIDVAAAGNLSIKDTVVKICRIGLNIANPSGTVLASIDRCHFDRNWNYGVYVEPWNSGVASVFAQDSAANQNDFAGWHFTSASSLAATLVLESCTGSQNGRGLEVLSGVAGSVARTSNGTFADNGMGLWNDSANAALETRGNNTVSGNQFATTGTIGSFAAK